MGARQLSPQDRADLIWFCLRLAANLQGGNSLRDALANMLPEASPSQKEAITRAQRCLRKGEQLSEAWLTRLPGFAWVAMRAGELGSRLPEALSRLADWLEAEQSAPQTPSVLRSYALAFGRLGMMLSLRVPILSALEKAAEVPDAEVTEVLFAARAALSEGVGLGDALARLAPDLPPLTTEMIRDGEEEGRLDQALSVVSDYLLDQAENEAPQEVSRA